MDRSNIINLISQSYSQDAIGQYVPTETSTQVYCNRRYVTRAEWFEAGRNGHQPAFCFEMFAPDYDGQLIVEFEGERYGVYRTYLAQNETIELYVEAKGGLYEQSES